MSEQISKERLAELIGWHESFPLNPNGADSLAALRELQERREREGSELLSLRELWPALKARAVLKAWAAFHTAGTFDWHAWDEACRLVYGAGADKKPSAPCTEALVALTRAALAERAQEET